MGCYVKNDWSNVRKKSDPDNYMFFEQGMRGGVSYFNKHLKVSICKASKSVNILYLDMNNLYGCAMRKYLLINYYKWVKNVNKIEQKLMNIKNNSSTGYVLKVDLEYQQELHDIHIHNCMVIV